MGSDRPKELYVRWRSRSPHENGQFWGIEAPIVNVLKRLNRSIRRLGFGLEWAEGCTSSIVLARWRQSAVMGGHIATTWRMRLNHPSTVAMRLMSNYFDHPEHGFGVSSAKCSSLNDNEMAFVSSLRENLLRQHVVTPTRQRDIDTPDILI